MNLSQGGFFAKIRNHFSLYQHKRDKECLIC